MLKVQFLFILLSSFLLDQYVVTGRLVDHQYNPVTYFIVKVYKSNQQKEKLDRLRIDTVHHQNGEFKIGELNKGSYLLEIDVPDYTGYTISVDIKDRNRSMPEIQLQPTR
ncbi:hypothetical protein [Sphingobacterium sp. GVS05A]|uniref:hypothetical protein n=1 Tax=Sphingobacterium TaxID=28453 RepID=UPI001CBBC223|nr:hypothetical protein [Sphingobacterium sp. GVS05A]